MDINQNSKPEALEEKKRANLLYSKLLNYIRTGDVDAICIALDSPNYFKMTRVIIGNNIDFARTVMQFLSPQIARAAIEGGLTEIDSAEIYLNFIDAINNAKTVQGLLKLHRKMLTDYAERVATAYIDISLSPLARRCYSYIREHVSDRITPRDIAASLHVSRSYLSHVYKNETGKTISECIYKEKISTAKILMRYSMLNMAEIAYQLAFSSQSRFTEVFHKLEGVTPRQYRNNL